MSVSITRSYTPHIKALKENTKLFLDVPGKRPHEQPCSKKEDTLVCFEAPDFKWSVDHHRFGIEATPAFLANPGVPATNTVVVFHSEPKGSRGHAPKKNSDGEMLRVQPLYQIPFLNGTTVTFRVTRDTRLLDLDNTEDVDAVVAFMSDHNILGTEYRIDADMVFRSEEEDVDFKLAFKAELKKFIEIWCPDVEGWCVDQKVNFFDPNTAVSYVQQTPQKITKYEGVPLYEEFWREAMLFDDAETRFGYITEHAFGHHTNVSYPNRAPQIPIASHLWGMWRQSFPNDPMDDLKKVSFRSQTSLAYKVTAVSLPKGMAVFHGYGGNLPSDTKLSKPSFGGVIRGDNTHCKVDHSDNDTMQCHQKPSFGWIKEFSVGSQKQIGLLPGKPLFCGPVKTANAYGANKIHTKVFFHAEPAGYAKYESIRVLTKSSSSTRIKPLYQLVFNNGINLAFNIAKDNTHLIDLSNASNFKLIESFRLNVLAYLEENGDVDESEDEGYLCMDTLSDAARAYYIDDDGTVVRNSEMVLDRSLFRLVKVWLLDLPISERVDGWYWPLHSSCQLNTEYCFFNPNESLVFGGHSPFKKTVYEGIPSYEDYWRTGLSTKKVTERFGNSYAGAVKFTYPS